MRPTLVRPQTPQTLEKIAVATLAALALADGPAGGIIGAAPHGPEVTVHASYSPKLRNILYHGILRPAPGQMLESIQFRLEAGGPEHWYVASSWMALITGIHAHWWTNGHYTGGLMQMNAPVGRGTYRVEVQATDDDGGVTDAYSNVLRVK